MRSQLIIGVGALAVVASAVVAGCPPQLDCQNQNDCDIGKVCNKDSKCVDAPPPPPGIDAGPFEGEGEGGVGEGEGGDDVVFFDDAISMFQIDPRSNGELALVGIHPPGGGLDQIESFDIVNGVADGVRLFDFASQGGIAGCGPDTVTFLSNDALGQGLPGDRDELWFSCNDPGSVQIQYNDDFAQLFAPTNMSAAEVVVPILPLDPDQTGVEARFLVAKRGGTQLQVIVIDDQGNDIFTNFGEEPITGVTFTHIEQIFVISEGDIQNGDVILVFDRASPPKLVPLQREINTGVWHGAPFGGDVDPALRTLDLPADTSAVFFRETVGVADLTNLPNRSADDDDTVNLVALRPTNSDAGNGLVTSARYEAEVLGTGDFGEASGFSDTLLQADDAPVATELTDRVLLVPREIGSGAATQLVLYYALTRSDHAWRIPIPIVLADDTTDDVGRVAFAGAGVDIPSNMVLDPDDDQQAWFSFSNQDRVNELDLLPFIGAF